MAAAIAGNKQAELVKSITSAVVAELSPLLKQIDEATAERHAEVIVRIEAITTRLELLETVSSGAKKATKTSAGKAPASKGGKAAGKGAATEDPRDKVKNSMLYFRWAWANDQEFHDAYATGEIQDALDADENLSKKKDAKERLLAEGTAVWKAHLTTEQKNDIRIAYGEWTKQREAATGDEQLDEAAENGDE